MDTTGWAVPYPIVWLAGARVAAYVHYPTISTDMLACVRRRDAAFNNAADVSASGARTLAKLLYYRAFAVLYGFCGLFPEAVMVNSSWTLGHIRQLWWRRWRSAPHIVYPPCDVSHLAELPLARARGETHLCSIAQFRPEKDHRCDALCWCAIEYVMQRTSTS